MDGAMTGGSMRIPGTVVRTARAPAWAVAPGVRSALAAVPDAVVGGVDLARALFGLLAQLGRGAGHLVGVVLRHQAAIGLVDLGIAGLGGQPQRAVRRAGPGATDPAGVEGMADQQPDQAAP